MTVAERLTQRLERGRAVALARMTSRAVVRRGGEMVTDPETGMEGPGWADVHVDIPFRLDGGSTGDGGSRTITVGGVQYEQATAVGHMPADTADLADNDVILVLSGEWAGSYWQIVEAVKADQKTARRVPIVETTEPEGWV